MGDGERTQGAVPDGDPADFDTLRLTEAQLLETALAVSAEITRLEAIRVRLMDAVDSRCRVDVLGHPNAKAWLAAHTMLEPGAAGRIVNLARGLRAQPEVAGKFYGCRISADHAGLILRFCERPPKGMPLSALGPVLDALLTAAHGPQARTDLIREGIAKVERIFESDEHPASEDLDRNELHASKTLNGRVSVKGDLDAVTGEMLLTALSKLAAPRPAKDGARDERTPGRRRADAFTELLRRYLAAGLNGTEAGERPHISVQVRARDFAHARGTDRTGGTSAHTSSPSGDGPASAEDWAAVLAETGVAWAAWMGPLTITAARHLACDAQVSTVILDDHGAPLDVGLTSRTATRKQRRALAVRDGGCAFPGCGALASWCEAHHAVHWVDGGLTDMDNLVLLCGFHHRLIHHDGWEVQIGADRHPWFIPPPSVDPFRQPLPSHNRRAGPAAA
ncbi:HNH endonuclease signature motif containing protein [Rhodococcus sp. NCIMB 12038]|uniref:HNH endonuclease signature motif containing protein n=1 Tax=Rhodococcus sp. NCIMB 12038 TaxID=933800 RepID=UPI000B3C44F1|nr:HNH endonuclease signature motif containing protein [Rhodococcus sp. NCIMB 12038]OUS93265.1 HNH endonuclease [Rhodococcus sp. NCIMB 12038]